jgi:membrane protein required for colicin V production
MLTWADIALLCILGISAVVGIWRGFVSEVMSVAVWVASFWLSFAFGPDVAAMFDAHVDSPSARWFLGYVVVFLAALAAGGLLTWLIGKLVKSTGLSGTDRLLGLAFGLLRGLAVACVLVLVLGFTPMPAEAFWQESRLMPAFERGAQWLKTWLPATLAQHLSFDPASLIELPTGATPASPEAGEPGAGTPGVEPETPRVAEHAGKNAS